MNKMKPDTILLQEVHLKYHRNYLDFKRLDWTPLAWKGGLAIHMSNNVPPIHFTLRVLVRRVGTSYLVTLSNIYIDNDDALPVTTLNQLPGTYCILAGDFNSFSQVWGYISIVYIRSWLFGILVLYLFGLFSSN